MKTLRKLAGPLLLITLSTLLTLVFIEVFLRVGFDTLPANVQGDLQSIRRVPWQEEVMVEAIPLQTSADYHTVLAPGFNDFSVRWHDARFKFDTRPIWEGHWIGLRNATEPQWPLDIVAFGDSFTFCWTEYEDCWVQQLGSEYGWNVINAGQPGTGSGGQVVLLKELAGPLRPRVIVWQWYTNDISDEFVLSWLREETEWLEWPPSAPIIEPAEGFAQYSALYRLLDINILNPPEGDSEYEHNQMVEINGESITFASGEYAHPFSFDYESTVYGWDPHVQYRMDGVQHLLDLCANEADPVCIEMVMVLIPTKEEAYAEILADDALSIQYLENIEVSRLRFLELCDENSWRCIDTTPALREAVANGDNVYYMADFHLNSSGNEVVQQLVGEYLIANALLDAPTVP